MRRSWHHAAALSVFILLAVVQTWPLSAHLSTHLPGDHIGDNAVFAWNVWWMRQAFTWPHNFFETDAIFAPEGVTLVLHTHTALGAAAVAPLAIDPITATNLLVIACVALNGYAAYVLARMLGASPAGAALAGVMFLGAPPLTTRLMGHFNLLYAWTMAFAMALVVAASRRPSRWRAAAAGAALGAVAWADYYLFVFSIVVLAAIALLECVPWRVAWQRRQRATFAIAIAVASVVTVAVAIAVGMTGGFALDVLGAHVSMRSTTNLFTIGWALIIAWWFATRQMTIARTTALTIPRDAVVSALAGCGLVLLPLAWFAIALWWSGDYVSPPQSWRSAPPGADVVSFILGPPHHPLIGPAVIRAYAAMRIDPIEMSGWLGVIGPVLAVITIRQARREATPHAIVVVGLVFLVWSLGAFLHIAGANTGILLPQQFARFVPVLGNARMPSRALIVVSLAIALLAAQWARERRTAAVCLVAALVLLEQWAAPLAIAAVPSRAIDRQLAALPDGVVLELPFGYRDGFGAHGAGDSPAMLAQIVHGKPIVGGFAARLPARVIDGYTRNATLDSAARLSAGEATPPPTCADAMRDLQSLRVRYIVAAHGVFDRWLDAIPRITKWNDVERTLYELGPRCP